MNDRSRVFSIGMIVGLGLCGGTFVSGATAVAAGVNDHAGSAKVAGIETEEDWRANSAAPFAEGEAAFHSTLDKLLHEFVEPGVTKDMLYRAATAGMLASLNTGEHYWNRLLTPEESEALQSGLGDKISGIGISIKFEEAQGYGLILNVLPNSPALRAGLLKDDLILSVDGKKFKGHPFKDLVAATRGKTGETVRLKILRDDQISTFNVKRESISWSPVTYEKLNDTTGVLAINYFTQGSPQRVEEKLEEVNRTGMKNLIVDVRDNSGGSYEAAVHVTEMFLVAGKTIVKTQDRGGHIETVVARHTILKPEINLVVLTDKGTSSGAELFAGALKESRHARTLGTTTFGKWNAQTVEPLPNHYALKFTVKRFLTPDGNSYQDLGMAPDIEVDLPKGVDPRELEARKEIKFRIQKDPQLRAAIGLLN